MIDDIRDDMLICFYYDWLKFHNRNTLILDNYEEIKEEIKEIGEYLKEKKLTIEFIKDILRCYKYYKIKDSCFLDLGYDDVCKYYSFVYEMDIDKFIKDGMPIKDIEMYMIKNNDITEVEEDEEEWMDIIGLGNGELAKKSLKERYDINMGDLILSKKEKLIDIGFFNDMIKMEEKKIYKKEIKNLEEEKKEEFLEFYKLMCFYRRVAMIKYMRIKFFDKWENGSIGNKISNFYKAIIDKKIFRRFIRYVIRKYFNKGMEVEINEVIRTFLLSENAQIEFEYNPDFYYKYLKNEKYYDLIERYITEFSDLKREDFDISSEMKEEMEKYIGKKVSEEVSEEEIENYNRWRDVYDSVERFVYLEEITDKEEEQIIKNFREAKSFKELIDNVNYFLIERYEMERKNDFINYLKELKREDLRRKGIKDAIEEEEVGNEYEEEGIEREYGEEEAGEVGINKVEEDMVEEPKYEYDIRKPQSVEVELELYQDNPSSVYTVNVDDEEEVNVVVRRMYGFEEEEELGNEEELYDSRKGKEEEEDIEEEEEEEPEESEEELDEVREEEEEVEGGVEDEFILDNDEILEEVLTYGGTFPAEVYIFKLKSIVDEFVYYISDLYKVKIDLDETNLYYICMRDSYYTEEYRYGIIGLISVKEGMFSFYFKKQFHYCEYYKSMINRFIREIFYDKKLKHRCKIYIYDGIIAYSVLKLLEKSLSPRIIAYNEIKDDRMKKLGVKEDEEVNRVGMRKEESGIGEEGEIEEEIEEEE